LWNVALSVQSWSPFKPSHFAGLIHYEELLFQDEVFWKSLWNTVVFMSSSPIAIALALGLALLVDTRIRGRGIYRAIIFISYPLMTVAVGIIWRWLYDEKVGLINYVLLSLHLTQRRIAFLDSYEWAKPSVVVAAVWQIVGFFMVILLAGLQNIPPNLQEAAALDGASGAQRFRHITLPLLRPAIFLCLMIGVINSFTSFDLIYVMTRGGPADTTKTASFFVYQESFSYLRAGSGAAYAVAVTLLSGILITVYVVVLRKRERVS
jgi:ABC-type sugar transport system permease subunit